MTFIDKSEVLRYLGYRGQEISESIDGMINESMMKITEICTPKNTYALSDIEEISEGLYLPQVNITLSGNDIAKHLHKAERCIILACTLGNNFETALMRLQAKSITESLIFDAVGTAYIEAYADETEERLLSPFMKSGFFSKFRYSPGYGDLPISLQKSIITSLQCAKKIGLTVTDTNILIPRKSITAFIGVFDSPQEKPNSKCDLCSNKDICNMRKEGYACD